ncbi:TetR-like C-terminal domain-containing protein [Croceicoccus sp. F390]|uniref:TetR-like C-terminal domain-containing protein n=1 Tax=Croceicoccus esteveae TaxID=3075597 RepID=A0ABU2ZKF3_9SPHN|nr:TetR-like C-terminal domain-containing protein [Croceicoccus sp. F390]MDT0577089.1 TetR-like C-terminal domain-containing protein [Croceicoccus sp. F390]
MPSAIAYGEAMTGRQARRPGGRTEKNRKAVADAVLALIGQGRLDFEIQEVAALAGVHRTTLFRRWPDRAALISEAMAEHVSRLSIPLSGNWEEDMHRVAFGMRDFLADPVENAMNRMLAMTDNAIFREQMFSHWTPILQEFRRPIVDAQARGELPEGADASAAMWMLMSSIVVGVVFQRTPPTDEFLGRLVDQVIRGCR